MFTLSDGLTLGRLTDTPSFSVKVLADTITAGDGDGTGGRDTLTDSGSGFGSFAKHDYILIGSVDANDNIRAKILSVNSSVIEVPADTLTAVAAGSVIGVFKMDPKGSFQHMFQNCTIDLFAEPRPATANDAEPGAVVASFSLNGNPFVGGLSENGLNFGVLNGLNLKRGIDPETGLVEVWRATPTSSVVVNSCRIYANDKVTGASSASVRADGVVATSGGDLNITQGPSITAGVPIDISDAISQHNSSNVV